MLSLPDSGDPATGGIQGIVRDMALIEEESILVCATIRPNGKIIQDLRGHRRTRQTPVPASTSNGTSAQLGALRAQGGGARYQRCWPAVR